MERDLWEPPFSAPFWDAARDVDGTLSFLGSGRSVLMPIIQYLMASRAVQCLFHVNIRVQVDAMIREVSLTLG